MNPFFPEITPPGRGRDAVDRAKLREVLRIRDATLELRRRTELNVTRQTSGMWAVGLFLGTMLVFYAADRLTVWTAVGYALAWTLVSALQIWLIRRRYLRDLADLQAPELNRDARPGSHPHNTGE